MRSLGRLLQVATLGSSLTLLGTALGEGRDPAAAEALFRAARSAVERGDYRSACPKFEESHRLDPAVGTLFNPPAAMTLPNVDGLKPREVTEMYSYDHDLSTFVAIGTATVSADGSVLSSDPGVGVLKAGWHCGGNPNQTGSAATCPECQKCQGANCAPDPARAGTTCDDHNKCTENDKCLNGSCTGTPVDTGTWKDDSSLTAKVTLPTGLVEKINSALGSVPFFPRIQFTTASVGASGRMKDCCDPKVGKVTNGVKEGNGLFELGADVKGIPLAGLPTLSKDFDYGFVDITVDFEVGIMLDGKFTFTVKGGYRENACKNESCGFGSIEGQATVALKATASAILCAESFWTDKHCVGLTITPAELSFPTTAGVSWNAEECNTGFSGFITLGKIEFLAHFDIGIPTAGSIEFSHEIWGGATFRFP